MVFERVIDEDSEVWDEINAMSERFWKQNGNYRLLQGDVPTIAPTESLYYSPAGQEVPPAGQEDPPVGQEASPAGDNFPVPTAGSTPVPTAGPIAGSTAPPTAVPTAMPQLGTGEIPAEVTPIPIAMPQPTSFGDSTPSPTLPPKSSEAYTTLTDDAKSPGIIVVLIILLLLIFMLYACWRCWKRKREQHLLNLRSAQADSVLGDMQMIPSEDPDAELL